ncbi:hypothetical protein B0W44_09485 [Novibacillus thermophilus]|uniref:Luciferase-like domain-containing protein n=1 Tax=Novibacillus thermophilus TaxID=1471761 RepID=A0A1U9K7F8_9BACL|nr:hypothetical protein B0W44_09485 [Novibacillus thermophilus]
MVNVCAMRLKELCWPTKSARMCTASEHHRADYTSSAPAIVLAAAAIQTKRLSLTSAVSVFSSDDPMRAYQDFATLDALFGRVVRLQGIFSAVSLQSRRLC